MSRASNIFKSFTAGFSSTLMTSTNKNEKENTEKSKKGKEDDDENLSEDEKKRVLAAIMDDDSSDEDSNSDEEVSQNSAGLVKNKNEDKASDSGSFCSDKDIYNRDLENDCGEALDSENYLRYASDKYNQKLDILEIVDKNERSFK